MQEVDLKLFLAKFTGQEVDFFRPQGNYGDSVIWHGTMNLLSDLQIKTNKVNLLSKIKNDILFIDGCGNFVDYYDNVRNFLKNKHTLYRQIVFMPQTICGQKQKKILKNLKNAVIFCREKKSALFCEKFAKNSKVYLWHDCAFYNQFTVNQIGQGVLSAFREDRESIISHSNKFNIDISKNGDETKPLKQLLDFINQYEEINTDRLHIAITAALLGKKVTLYSNSYFKNEAVYEYTLKKYPNVKFIKIGLFKKIYALFLSARRNN